MISINGFVLKEGDGLTLFPDGTSQVWQLPEEVLTAKVVNITWEFESEGELMQLAQLTDLIHVKDMEKVTLHMPFLPYARQDKLIANNGTFALHSFARIINSMMFDEVTSLDVHSSVANECIDEFRNIEPNSFIAKSLCKSPCSVICYPDSGAANRYNLTTAHTVLVKRRNQLTGDIVGLEIQSGVELIGGQSILIVDDICDGGRTFIEACKVLLNNGAKEVNLYTTHGIYSKGLKPLFEAGISRIFNYKGEVTESKDGNLIIEEN